MALDKAKQNLNKTSIDFKSRTPGKFSSTLEALQRQSSMNAAKALERKRTMRIANLTQENGSVRDSPDKSPDEKLS